MAARPTSFFSLNGPLFSPTTPAHAEHTWPNKWSPIQLRPWFVGILAGLYVALAIGIEVAYVFSVKNHGFDASRSPWSLSSTQFLKSFLSALLIAPLGVLLHRQDEIIKLLQPYVDLAESSATAERSLLLDYVTASSLESVYRGALNKHTAIVVSTSACLLALLLQPLAGSLFTIRPTQINLPQSTAAALTQLGLNNFTDLEAFVAAAGFAEAAAFHGLRDPPSILGSWAVTDFEIPDASKGNNGSALFRTVGIRSEANCEPSMNVQITGPGPDGNYTLDAKFPSCEGSVSVNPRFGDTAGVQPAPQCATDTSINDSRAPAAFWFFLTQPINGTVVLCKPDVQVFNVNATVNATTNSLASVAILEEYPQPNPVIDFLSHGSLNGIAFDTKDFGEEILNNALILARAIATQGQLPAFILKSAKNQVESSSRQQFEGFPEITSNAYQQYLAIVAKSIFFTPQSASIPVMIRQYQARLWLDPLACHALTVILCLVAILLVYANWSHHATRSRIYLACPPGTVASAITLTSNSRWTAMIGPADDEAGVAKKLRGLQFRLDPITHHIIVEGEPIGRPRNAVPPNAPILDARMSSYSKTTLTPTPGENKHFSFQTGPNMVQSPMSPQPSFTLNPPPPQTYSPQPFTATVPPEHQALLSPIQRVSGYGDAAGDSPPPVQPATP